MLAWNARPSGVALRWFAAGSDGMTDSARDALAGVGW